MIVTDYKKLADRLQALAPLCSFEMPEALCEDKELYFRGLYDRTDKEITALHDRMNKEITALVNLASGAINDQVS